MVKYFTLIPTNYVKIIYCNNLTITAIVNLYIIRRTFKYMFLSNGYLKKSEEVRAQDTANITITILWYQI